jgi:hypothetical protein
LHLLCKEILDYSQNQATPHQSFTQNAPSTSPQPNISISTTKLASDALISYHQLLHRGDIQIRPLHTFQGNRDYRGNNGCCVISALVVAKHLANTPTTILSDQDIAEIIDNRCGPILQVIRAELTLGDLEMIQPSDAHNYLIDNNILQQAHFLDVATGNVLNEDHITQFINLFQRKNRTGGVFFFSHHVVSIIKIQTDQQEVYDFIDSIPATFPPNNLLSATQTRCNGLSALRILLNWYTTKKFSDKDYAHIDKHPSYELVQEGDPRLFQAFVWGN